MTMMMTAHVVSNEKEEDSSLLLEADLFALSTSISAKEELIFQLQASQEKYESMREFYEEKLKEMETILFEKEAETEKLSEELKLLDVGHSRGKELSEKLKQKQAQLVELKRKQAELTRLTTVASRNESQISRLKNEVQDMKQKKVDLQKQITTERKAHMVEMQKLKKETMKKDRELNKVKQENSKKTQEALRAQQVAKSRLDQMNQLKTKYKDTEKRLRMQTVKRGVLAKAGLDPVMVGRRQSTSQDTTVKIDHLRDFFDQKVADVSRREHLAMKLAQEWEEHLDLTTQKEEMMQKDDISEETLEALQSQIDFRETRIRQLASRLGKRERISDEKNPESDDEFLFDKNFEKAIGNTSPETAVKIAAKVLFGMVVRERRRIAALARTASQLDEKVQEAEAAAISKDAAFRSYVDEQRLEAAALAQNQQEHILSLMEMVKESPSNETKENDDSSNSSAKKKQDIHSSGSGNTKLLILANERIAVLERQLNEVSLGRDAVEKQREREESALSLLDEKKKECEDLEEGVDELRSTLRCIREELGRYGEEFTSTLDPEHHNFVQKMQDIVGKALHPSSASVASASKRRRSSSVMMGRSPSLTPNIKRETHLMHSSDSDEDMPDWADDIMADLAMIAEGKMPASLLGSKEVLEAEAQLENSVFDRLTNPESFTGIQKHSQTNHAIKTKPSSSRSAGQKQRKMISMQVAQSLNKVVIPGEREKKKVPGRKSREKIQSSEDAEKRSVFDRLLSPSNLTGTQKTKFHHKKGRNLEKAIESNHVALRGGRQKNTDQESDSSEGYDAENLLDDILMSSGREFDLGESRIESQSSSKRDDYKKRDVFERLNKTTTQAYAVKQNTNIAEKMLDDILVSSDSSVEEEHPRHEPRFERLEEYASQNVFERLQRTTTEAYAKKKNSSASEDGLSRATSSSSSPSDLGSPIKSRMNNSLNSLPSPPSSTVQGPPSPKYQNVFERLQHKTTEAYAQKKHPPVE